MGIQDFQRKCMCSIRYLVQEIQLVSALYKIEGQRHGIRLFAIKIKFYIQFIATDRRLLCLCR